MSPTESILSTTIANRTVSSYSEIAEDRIHFPIARVFQAHELGVQGDRDELLQIPPKSDRSHSSPCYASKFI
jgi:hypothetical protein